MTRWILAGLAGLLAACGRVPSSAAPAPEVPRMIEGTVTYRARLALPPSARLEVWIARDGGIGTAVLAGRVEEAVNGRQVPLPFRVPVETATVDPTARYVLRAVISADGRPVFETAEPVPVLGPAAPPRLDLVLVPVAAEAPPSDDLVGTSWRLESLAGAAVLAEAVPTLEFPEAGRVAGRASCNRLVGTATRAGASLRFGALGSTRMACAEPVMRQEAAFLEALGKVERVERRGDTLLLTGGGLPAPLRFVRGD